MRRSRFYLTLNIILLVYICICLYLWANQKRFIYEPTRVITKTPAIYGLGFEDVFIPVGKTAVSARESGDTIHGWWIPSKKRSDKALLYLHGSAYNISANVAHARRLNEMGFSVLLVDYRGYGLSDGKFPSEEAVYEDADAAWNYLVEEKSFQPENIVIYGHSLGGAVGIRLAIHHPEAAGLVVESTFTSIIDVAAYRKAYRLFPLNLIVNQRFDSITRIGELKVPILYIHGLKDDAVPVEMSYQLYESTRAPKRILVVPDGTHNNNAGKNETRYIEAVTEFLAYASNERSKKQPVNA